MRGEQRHWLDVGFAEDVEERRDLDARGTVAGEHFRSAMQVDRAEGIEIGTEGNKGIGFLHEGADGDAHGLLSQGYEVNETFQNAGGCAGVKFSRCVLMPYRSW